MCNFLKCLNFLRTLASDLPQGCRVRFILTARVVQLVNGGRNALLVGTQLFHHTVSVRGPTVQHVGVVLLEEGMDLPPAVLQLLRRLIRDVATIRPEDLEVLAVAEEQLE